MKKYRLERLEQALREIDTSSQLPKAYLDNPTAQAEWWKHLASKRREIARDALAEVEPVASRRADP